jgi:hypothetical protein
MRLRGQPLRGEGAGAHSASSRGSNLTPEESVAEFERYEKLISDILSRFKDDKIADTDAEIMSQWIAEITDFLNYSFGQNWYANNILTWYNYRNQYPTANVTRKIV